MSCKDTNCGCGVEQIEMSQQKSAHVNPRFFISNKIKAKFLKVSYEVFNDLAPHFSDFSSHKSLSHNEYCMESKVKSILKRKQDDILYS